MRLIFIFLLFTFWYASVRATDLVLGNMADGVVLANHTRIEYTGIPLIKRIKYLFYSSLSNKPISGIKALDHLHTKATSTVIAGGIGYLYVDLRFKSEVGTPIAYGVAFYVDPDINNL